MVSVIIFGFLIFSYIDCYPFLILSIIHFYLLTAYLLLDETMENLLMLVLELQSCCNIDYSFTFYTKYENRSSCKQINISGAMAVRTQGQLIFLNP